MDLLFFFFNLAVYTDAVEMRKSDFPEQQSTLAYDSSALGETTTNHITIKVQTDSKNKSYKISRVSEQYDIRQCIEWTSQVSPTLMSSVDTGFDLFKKKFVAIKGKHEMPTSL